MTYLGRYLTDQSCFPVCMLVKRKVDLRTASLVHLDLVVVSIPDQSRSQSEFPSKSDLCDTPSLQQQCISCSHSSHLAGLDCEDLPLCVSVAESPQKRVLSSTICGAEQPWSTYTLDMMLKTTDITPTKHIETVTVEESSLNRPRKQDTSSNPTSLTMHYHNLPFPIALPNPSSKLLKYSLKQAVAILHDNHYHHHYLPYHVSFPFAYYQFHLLRAWI